MAFSQKVTEAGLAPSVGAVGAPFDNGMVEAFWARMQVELLNRRRVDRRIEMLEVELDRLASEGPHSELIARLRCMRLWPPAR